MSELVQKKSLLYDNIVGDSRDVLRFLKLFSRHETHKSSELVSSLQEIIWSLGIPILYRINHQLASYKMYGLQLKSSKLVLIAVTF